MANTKFQYVRKFEQQDCCLLNTWIVVRLDGRCFHKFAEVHNFNKPNDDRALNLMTCCASTVMKEFTDIVISYGQSDEYSFVFKKTTTIFSRRASFDARVIMYPSEKNLRDYLSWRQADCHINNLYNTCFWSLINSGVTNSEAQKQIKDMCAAEKNELLFSKFDINYNKLPQLYRKGTTVIWQPTQAETTQLVEQLDAVEPGGSRETKKQIKPEIFALNVDIIGEQFWNEHSYILS